MKTPTEVCPSLDVRQLNRTKALVPGNRRTRRWPGTNPPVWVKVYAYPHHVDLAYQVAGVSRSLRVRLEYTFPNYGGRRPWFLCACGKRVAILYQAGQSWECRSCGNLNYISQLQNQFERAYRRMGVIHERLGTGWDGRALFPPPPMKPPRMHEWTYYRLLAQLVRCQREMFGKLGDPAELLTRLTGEST